MSGTDVVGGVCPRRRRFFRPGGMGATMTSMRAKAALNDEARSRLEVPGSK